MGAGKKAAKRGGPLEEISEAYEEWENKGPKIRRAQPKIYTRGFSPEQVYYQIKVPTDIVMEQAKECLAGYQDQDAEISSDASHAADRSSEEEEVGGESIGESSGGSSSVTEGESESEEDVEDSEDREVILNYLEGELETDDEPFEESAQETIRKLDRTN